MAFISGAEFMLKNTKELYGNRIDAADGEVGMLEDFYFDDKHWVIRYVVADTGSWLSGRLVLLSPHYLSEGDLQQGVLTVKLQRKQIQNSPSIQSHVPVSRQYEIEYYKYYGLPAYWPTGDVMDLGRNSSGTPLSIVDIGVHLQRRHRENKHLQSTKAVTGFHIMAIDGMIGHVSGFFVDDRGWSIPALVVEAGHWYSEKEVLISCSNVDRISYDDSTVFVNLTRSDIQKTLKTNLAKAIVGEDQRNRFQD
jgi:hypothetical protein